MKFEYIFYTLFPYFPIAAFGILFAIFILRESKSFQEQKRLIAELRDQQLLNEVIAANDKKAAMKQKKHKYLK